MALSDELAYLGVIEIARGIRQRRFSPVEVVDAFIARIEARDRSINAFVYRGFDEARGKAKDAEKALTDGRPLGPLHGVPVAIKDLFDFKPGWISTFGGIRAMQQLQGQLLLCVCRAHRKRRRYHPRKDQQPGHGFSRHVRQLFVRTAKNPFDTSKKPAARRAAALPRSRTDCCRSRKGRTAADP